MQCHNILPDFKKKKICDLFTREVFYIIFIQFGIPMKMLRLIKIKPTVKPT